MNRIKTVLEAIGVPNEKQARHNRALAVPILGLVALLFLALPPTPKPAEINGIYSNPCCNPVTIRDGVLVADAGRFPFKLYLMKYGLEARINADLIVEEGKVIRSAKPFNGSVLFNERRTSFVLCARVCGEGNEFAFARVQSAKRYNRIPLKRPAPNLDPFPSLA